MIQIIQRIKKVFKKPIKNKYTFYGFSSGNTPELIARVEVYADTYGTADFKAQLIFRSEYPRVKKHSCLDAE